MPDQDRSSSVAELRKENARLKESLTKCRALVADCRAKLSGEEEQQAKRSAFSWKRDKDA